MSQRGLTGRSLGRPRAALLRGVSDNFEHALREHPDGRLDVALARSQHAAYADALRGLGIAVTVLPAGRHADGCFTEDAAVVLGRHALVTRPGAEPRRSEVGLVAGALAAMGCIVHRMAAPATLEGGDVLRIGDTLLVGVSKRSNEAGLRALARVAAVEGVTVQAVPIDGQVHLKGAVSLVNADTAIIDPTLLDRNVIAAAGVRVIDAQEQVGANVLALGDGVVMVPVEAPRTQACIEALGHHVIAVPASELQRADGRLTCPSLRLPHAGQWCC